MKKFIAFFVLIYKWFISLFASKKKKKTLAELYEEAKKRNYSTACNPQIPSHNNRKVKKGRLVQYINVGFGRKRAIYHSAK